MLAKHGFIPQCQDGQDKYVFRIEIHFFMALMLMSAVGQPSPLSKV